MIRRALLWWVLLCVFSSCKKTASSATYQKAIASGLASVPAIQEFAKLFPRSNHQISHYMIGDATPVWASEVGLFGRYVVNMHVTITLDKSGEKIVSSGPPRFVIWEVSSVTQLPDGRWSIRYNTKAEVKFDQEKWRQIVENDGDIGVVVPSLQKDKPIKDFQHAWGFAR